MKDFLVDSVQVGIAAERGASGVLLIVRILSGDQLEELTAASRELNLTALVECHTAPELDRALLLPDVVIGINNRDLDSFETDRCLAETLLRQVPPDRVVVAESGYQRPADVAGIRGLADAVLIGTALMRAGDPAAFLRAVG